MDLHCRCKYFCKSPALVLYNTKTKSARRLLEGHSSVVAENFVPVAQGVKMLIFGIFAIRPGVDSIALDRNGDWLYYAAVTSQWLYRIPTKALRDPQLSEKQLAQKVEKFAPKTVSDGITTDLKGNVYITDFEHSAIHMIGQDKKLTTLLRDKRLRWPDGLSFGPEQSLYITCSALQHVIMKSQSEIKQHAPYHIWRFRPGYHGIAGH